MIRIGIDLRREDEHSGVGVVTNLLKNGLMPQYQLHQYYSKWGKYFKKVCINKAGPLLLDYGWKQVVLPLSCFFRSLDVFISPAQPSPYWLPCKNVVFVHDVIQPFERQKGIVNGLLAYQVIPISCRRASHIITDAFAVKKELIETFKIPDYKIHVLHLAVKNNPVKDVGLPMDSNARASRHTVELISVFSSLTTRKNHAVVYHALHTLHDKMCVKWSIIGPPDMPRDYDSWRFRHGITAKANIHFYSKVEEADLQMLYATADALVMPSKYEGFGLPLIEALYSGTTHILCSDIPVFHEVSRSSTRFGFFNPDDPNSIACLIQSRMLKPPQHDTSDVLEYYTLDAYRKRLAHTMNAICSSTTKKD